ncbi:MAG TPA: hypothetical protein VF201_15595 [Nitrolancea sp.]
MARTIEDAIRAAGVSDDDAASAKRFAGYLGNSNLASRTRLYLNEQLNEYIEVATDVIVKMIDLGGENSPLVLILVPPEAFVQHTAIVSEQIEADFLAGDIAQRNLQANRVLWSLGSGPDEFVLAPTDGCTSMGGHCRQIGPATRRERL